MAANGNVLGFDGTGKSGGWQIVVKISKRTHLARGLHGLGAREGLVVAEPHRPHQALTPARRGVSPTAIL